MDGLSPGDQRPVRPARATRDPPVDLLPEPGATLGGRKQQVLAQDGFPENVLWLQSKAVFATLHVVGSNNGLAPWNGLGLATPTAAQLAEVDARAD